MLNTTLALATPLKMLNGLEAGLLRMHAGDYRQIARGIQGRLDALGTGELISLSRSAQGALGQMAEATVFDRSGCLVIGERYDRAETSEVFDALINRLRSGQADASKNTSAQAADDSAGA
jgi:hypothetical protein